MKTIILLLFPYLVFSQTAPKLLGQTTISKLSEAPFGEWFNAAHEKYEPNAATIEQLKQIPKKKLSVQIFMGTWCRDTQRELPRFIKTLETAGFKSNQIEIIAVDNAPETYKQSPEHQEIGKGIYRVATFIILKEGKELNRIVEFPVISLEKDLLQILKNEAYSPNYAAFSQVDQWYKEGILTDPNVSFRGLANALKGISKAEGELNAMGYIFLGRNLIKEAISILSINVYLYPESSNCYDSLAEAYLKNNQKETAIRYYEVALKLNPNSETLAKTIADLKASL